MTVQNRRLLDLADVARLSGLEVIELDGWRDNYSPGGEAYNGVLCHHTGSYDGLADAADDLAYALWMAFTGRSDLDPPLMNLALSAECKVFVGASGNANHAGQARASGPMPAASDGSRIYVGIEAMNSGSQGWDSKGVDAAGNELTQGEAYARLCAALCIGYEWPASHVRAHRETSVTGKWDPGLLDMDDQRAAVARLITNGIEDDMANYADQLDSIAEDARAGRRAAERSVTMLQANRVKDRERAVAVRDAIKADTKIDRHTLALAEQLVEGLTDDTEA